MKCIVGKKLGMTTLYHSEKGALPMTLLQCLPNEVVCVRKKDRDGYEAVQISYPVSSKKWKKREFRSENIDSEVGKKITVEIFSEGDRVTLVGTTKGKGFQGVVKRHGFHGSDQTHGHKHDHRAPGSIGSSFPEHVVKGKRMAGRMGGIQCTVRGSRIAYIDVSENLIGVCGPVPGSIGSIVLIREAIQ